MYVTQNLGVTSFQWRLWPVAYVSNCFISDCNDSKEYMQCINQLHQEATKLNNLNTCENLQKVQKLILMTFSPNWKISLLCIKVASQVQKIEVFKKG